MQKIKGMNILKKIVHRKPENTQCVEFKEEERGQIKNPVKILCFIIFVTKQNSKFQKKITHNIQN